MAWIAIAIAAVCEVVWASCLDETQGWTRLWPSVLVLTTYMACPFLLVLAVRSVPASTVYAMWVGLGIVGVTLVEVLSGTPLSAVKALCLLLTVVGVVGLKLAS